jgi:hypothetical protein
MGEDMLTDREEYVSASIVSFEKLGWQQRIGAGATRCLPFLPNGTAA